MAERQPVVNMENYVKNSIQLNYEILREMVVNGSEGVTVEDVIIIRRKKQRAERLPNRLR